MAVKTITIDLEAYETLRRARRGNESFSTVIKKTLGPESRTAGALLRHIAEMGTSGDFVDSVDKVVAERENSPVAGERIDGS